MIGFPFDSYVSYDPQGNPIYDRAVSSQPLKTLISKLFSTGVMPNPSDNLQVFEGTSGMTVIVHPGFCVIEGGLKLEEENRTLEVQAADNNYDRIDTVVMRWDNNDAERKCDLYIVQGTPATSPVRPELNRVGSVYEIGLADIFVAKQTTSIPQYRITDTRMDAARCGIVSSISEFDTTTLYEQVQSDLADFKSEEQAEFVAWFQTIQDILDENVAAHLQNEIDDIASDVSGLGTRVGNLETFKDGLSAGDVGAGTFKGDVVAPSSTNYTTAHICNMVAMPVANLPAVGSTSTLPNGTLLIGYDA